MLVYRLITDSVRYVQTKRGCKNITMLIFLLLIGCKITFKLVQTLMVQMKSILQKVVLLSLACRFLLTPHFPIVNGSIVESLW